MTTKESSDEASWSAFKRAHVRYRRRGDDPNRSLDLPEMVDFSRGDDARIRTVLLPDKVLNDNDNNIYRGPIYGLQSFPGFYYAPQALSDALQFQVAYRAVTEYCEVPNATNIDLCPPKASEEPNQDEKMWELWKNENSANRQKQPRKKYRSFHKLSWATMGYHYDWTARCYHDGAKSPMPTLVADLASLFARTALILDSPSSSEASSLPFTASACIVNYYTTKSNMGGHRDDLELALDKPIVSMSVGLPAVFLLGGKTKDESPVLPILIRPGDVMCMGGDCRLHLHSMARVLPPLVVLPTISCDRVPNSEIRLSTKAFLTEQASSDANTRPSDQGRTLHSVVDPPRQIAETDRVALLKFLSSHRININVRQVYPDS
jgi:alkylated DNA repair protein alkB homolog 1